MIYRDASPPPCGPPCLLSLPPEVLEHVYLVMSIPDRLRLLRTCKLLNGIYRDSSLLAYDFNLHTLAYLDVPRRITPGEDDEYMSDSDDSDIPDSSPLSEHQDSSSRAVHLPKTLQELLDRLHDSHPEQEERLRAFVDDPYGDSDTEQEQFPNLGEPSRALRSPLRKDLHSIASRDQRLEDRERRWEGLDPKVTLNRVVSGPAGVYELQEGIFLLCDNYMGPDGPGTGRPMSIRLFKLPSSDTPSSQSAHDDPRISAHIRNMEMFGTVSKRLEMPYASHTLEFSIADLTMDPTQDLIVVSEYNPTPMRPNGLPLHNATPSPHRLHLLSMSTFKPHPSASSPTLDFPPFAQVIGSTRQLLQIMGDVLIVLVSRYAALWLGNVIPHIPGMESEEEIVVWNWKTGNVITRMALPENGWFSSLALLTPTSFMITSTSNISPIMSADSMEPRSIAAIFPPVIQIYSFLPDPAHSSSPLQPLSAEHEDDSTARPVLLAQLELPRFSERIVVSNFDVRPDPAFPPRRAADNGRPYPASGDKGFTQDPSKGVLVFDLDVMESPAATAITPRRWPHRAYELFVLRETLVEFAHQGEERLRKSRADATANGWANHRIEVIIPWTAWGIDNSRLLDISMKRRAWVCSCSGYRFVSLVRGIFTSRDVDHPDSDDDISLHEARMPHISDVRILDFSPFSVRKEVSRHSAILHDGEYPYVMPDSSVLSSAIATEGYYDDIAHGIRITEKPGTDGPKYEIWRNLHDCVWKRAITEPTILPKRRVFKEDVETRLAYVDTVRTEGIWSNGVMMDDQRIMVVSTEEYRGSPPKVEQKMTILCM